MLLDNFSLKLAVWASMTLFLVFGLCHCITVASPGFPTLLPCHTLTLRHQSSHPKHPQHHKLKTAFCPLRSPSSPFLHMAQQWLDSDSEYPFLTGV